jgi:predicted chitinase
MASRVVYGLSFSENGWRMVDQSSCTWIKVPGTNGSINLQIQSGQPAQILGAWAADWNAFVEPLRDRDSACWTPTNSVYSSNHLSGTACDLNWDSHPFRIEDAGLSDNQVATIREMLDFYEQTVFWGNDWNDPKDAMHVQMGYNTYGSENVDRVQGFINRKIRSDGFSTFRRGPLAAEHMDDAEDPTDIISDAMGGQLSWDRYKELTPAILQALQESECNNEKRIAMWMAQIGHESGGLQWMEEIADGSEYEGRTDLGNTQNGDGVRFKGRGPIQVTGRFNYGALSEWAFGKNLVPEPDFFVNNPEKLSDDQYGFLGAVWYWTVARPQINALCDVEDVNGVTLAINGGLNGIQDRVGRWNNAKSMSSRLWSLVDKTSEQPQPTPPGPEDNFMSALSAEEQRALYNEIMKQRTSRSPLRHAGEGTIGNNQDIESYMDANLHVLVVDLLARLGDPNTLSLLNEIANVNTTKHPDRKNDSNLAKAILTNALRLSSGQPAAQFVPVPQQSPPQESISLPSFEAVRSVPMVGDSLYGEIENFKNVLRDVSNNITQSVKGN